MKIGVFDSGLGGLSILREIIKALPEYDYAYLGDNARVPYGGRSEEIIYQYSKGAIDFLFNKDCKLIILACNTASSTALRRIQQEYLTEIRPDRRVLGVIRPAVEKVGELQIKRIGVIGTYATINSKAFIREIKKLTPDTLIYQQSCPLLVPIIEEGEIDWVGLKLILKKYLNPLKKKKIDCLILGCTHYGLITDKIQSVVGKKVKIISEGIETAVKLKEYLRKHTEIDNVLTKNRRREFYVTDLNSRYQKMAQLFLGKNFKDSTKLQLTLI